MKASSLCCCCLLKTSDKDLKTPHIRLGKTEIFSEMLEECFQIHLIQDSDEEHGICEVCMGRLQDASDFKLQVQRSQAALRAQLERPISVSDLDQLLSKMAEDDRTRGETLLHGGFVVKTETDIETTDVVLYEPSGSEVKAEAKDGERTDMLYEPSGPGVKSEAIVDDGSTDMLLLFDQDYISNSNQTTTDLEEPSTPIRSEKSDEATSDEDFPSFDQDYISNSNQTTDLEEPSTPIRSEKSDEATSDEDFPSCSGAGAPSLRTYSRRPQPAPTCPVRLEPLRDKAPQACQIRPNTCQIKPDTCDLDSSLATHTRKKNLKRRIHNDDKKYICDKCDKPFKKRKCLVEHMRIHMRVKLYSCEICNKKFVSETNLSEHKITHTSLKPFRFEICNKRFTLKTNLVKHIQLHTGHEIFICHICGTQFSQKYSLIGHISRIHNVTQNTPQRPYVCEICNKNFSSNSNLRRHKRTMTHTHRSEIF